MKTRLLLLIGLILVLLGLLLLPLCAALVSESELTASINSTSTTPGTTFGTGPVGFESGTDNRVFIAAFKLPYLAPGQSITGATITLPLVSKTGSPLASLDVYGLARWSTSSLAATGDFYIGTNDTANSRLAQAVVTPLTALGNVTVSNAALLSWIQTQYAASSPNALTSRYVFVRVNGNKLESSSSAFSMYNFGTSDLFRPQVPALSLTVTGAPTAASDRLQFSFVAPAGSVTSAGVYSSDGTTLKRTLWANVPASAGTNVGAWDGNDDFGNAMTGTYTVRVLTHSVSYVWEGVVGNSSTNTTGINVWRSLGPPVSLDVAGTTAAIAVGYNEGQCPFNSFSTTSIQSLNQVYNPGGLGDPNSNFSLVACDGTMSYWAKTVGGNSNPAYTYVIGIDSTNKPHTFSAGNAIPNTAGAQKYTSGFDLDTSSSGTNTQPNPATGLAVQKSGSFVFVAHSNLNVIRVFNKTTGATVGAISVTAPGLCATDASGNLYVLLGTSMAKYTISNTGAGTLGWTLSGLTAPLAIACDPSSSTVAVVDNGSIKAFNSATGSTTPTWTYGSAQTVPAVDNAHFYFIGQTPFAFQPGGSFWVGDKGNDRLLHFGVSGTTVSYIEQVAYLPESYQAAVDRNNPSRCFGNMLEYAQDFTKPLAGTNGSWTLVNNWRVGLPSDSTHNYDGYGTVGPDSVETLSNGHRYATIGNQATHLYDIYEIPPGGSTAARYTGSSVGAGAGRNRIYQDGSLRYSTVTTGTGGFSTYYQKALTGFDGSNNPTWGSPTTLMTVATRATGTASQYYPVLDASGTGARVEQTQGGFLPVYDPGIPPPRQTYHLGMIPVSGSSYSALSFLNLSQGTSYTGRLPINGQFDSGNGIANGQAGSVSMVYQRNVFLGYPGNYWKNSFASACYHFYEDGLMLGVFGTVGPLVPANAAVAGFAGNTLAPDMAFDSGTGTLHMWWNDESNHGGLGRWRIDNLSSVSELNVTGALGQVLSLSPPPSAPTGVVAVPHNTFATVAWSPVSGAITYNVLRSTASGSGYQPVASNVVLTTYNDLGLTNGVEYYYVVQAVNANGVSANSSEVNAIPSGPTGTMLIEGSTSAPVILRGEPGSTIIFKAQ